MRFRVPIEFLFVHRTFPPIGGSILHVEGGTTLKLGPALGLSLPTSVTINLRQVRCSICPTAETSMVVSKTPYFELIAGYPQVLPMTPCRRTPSIRIFTFPYSSGLCPVSGDRRWSTWAACSTAELSESKAGFMLQHNTALPAI